MEFIILQGVEFYLDGKINENPFLKKSYRIVKKVFFFHKLVPFNEKSI